MKKSKLTEAIVANKTLQWVRLYLHIEDSQLVEKVAAGLGAGQVSDKQNVVLTEGVEDRLRTEHTVVSWLGRGDGFYLHPHSRQQFYQQLLTLWL